MLSRHKEGAAPFATQSSRKMRQGKNVDHILFSFHGVPEAGISRDAQDGWLGSHIGIWLFVSSLVDDSDHTRITLAKVCTDACMEVHLKGMVRMCTVVAAITTNTMVPHSQYSRNIIHLNMILVVS